MSAKFDEIITPRNLVSLTLPIRVFDNSILASMFFLLQNTIYEVFFIFKDKRFALNHSVSKDSSLFNFRSISLILDPDRNKIGIICKHDGMQNI